MDAGGTPTARASAAAANASSTPTGPATGIDAASASATRCPKALSMSTPPLTPSSPTPGSPSRKPTRTGAAAVSSRPAATGSSSPTTATRPSRTRALSLAYAARLPCQSRWSSATLSTTPASGFSDGAQCSWKLDSSTANTSHGSPSTSITGFPMLPHSSARRPAAVSMACSIEVVVVLPLVPVTTSHCRGRPK